MTVSTQIIQRTYSANGVNRNWEVDFPLANREDLKVFITSPQGVQQEVENFVLNASATSVEYPALDSGNDPLASGWQVTLLRQTPLTQGIDLIRHGILDAEVLESGYDKLTLIAQEIQAACSQNKTDIAGNATALAAEVSTRQAADQTLQASFSAEVAARQAAVSAEASARQTADAALQTAINGKQAAGDYATNTALTSGLAEKLDSTTAASTYLTQSNAASTYLTQSNAASTYLTQTDAASTYATQSALTSGLAAKQDALSQTQLAAVNSGTTATTVAQVQTNTQAISAIQNAVKEQLEAWQKPASWVDIRSGALGNSVYFLVGHSADYATYPVFSLQATVSSSGTYDVYVDGVKQATTASETATSLTWQTLALTTGYDVTYPANLRTHVVRVTPSSSANSLSAIKLTQNSSVEQGVLWAHFTTESAIELDYCFGAADNNKKCLLLEAVTAENDELLVGRCRGAFRNCESLQQIPALNFNNQTISYALNSFGEKTAIKKVVIKNVVDNWGGDAFLQMGSLETIEMNNVKLVNNGRMYYGCIQLKKLPKLHFADSSTVGNITTANFLAGCTSLEDFFLDLSGVDNVILFRLGGASAARIDGLKGMTVSASAPFSSASSPQLDVSYTGMDKAALVCLFNSLPTVTNSQVCNITGAYGASALTSTDIAIAQNKGWTVTR